jgi:hypothetical protein
VAAESSLEPGHASLGWAGGPPACRRHSAASPGSERPRLFASSSPLRAPQRPPEGLRKTGTMPSGNPFSVRARSNPVTEVIRSRWRLREDSEARGLPTHGSPPPYRALPYLTRPRRSISLSRCRHVRVEASPNPVPTIGHEDPRFTLKCYAQATKRRERLSGPHLHAYDRAIEWARMGTTEPSEQIVAPIQATKNPA